MYLSTTARWILRVLAVLGVLITIAVLSGYGSALTGLLAGPKNPDRSSEVAQNTEALIAHGAQLYMANCQVCHGDRNGAGRIPAAPPHNQDGHTWHHSDRNLTDTILNGSGEMGEMMRSMMGIPADAPRMPAWKDKLSEEDIRAILGFIKTWWTPEQRRQQA
ncbi:MAG: cytochrome c, partial [Chloroflexi bacterium]|nr:cytochrome c [Chloroflexota bacterium]